MKNIKTVMKVWLILVGILFFTSLKCWSQVVVIEDLNACTHSEAIGIGENTNKKTQWWWRQNLPFGSEGTLLFAHENSSVSDITYNLSLKGRHAIYFGTWTVAPAVKQGFNVRLTKDESFSLIKGKGKPNAAEEVFWKEADITNQNIIFNHPEGTRSYIDYIKLVPITSAKENTVHWEFKDGTGSFEVKDSGQEKLHGKIIQPDRCIWAREDDRGFFLNFSGGAVQVESDKKLLYSQGLILDIHFSYSDSSFKKTNWASLLTKGNTPSDGYSVLIGKNGTLQLNFKGLEPSVKTIDLKLQTNVDHRLQITLGDGKVQVYLNGKLAQEYKVSGKLSDSGHPLFIGSIDNYPFHGNIYDVQLSAYRSGETSPPVHKEHTKVKKLVITDPLGTVTVTDFSEFTPKPMITTVADSSFWCFRSTAAFIPPGTGVLQPPENINAPEITFNPKLNGAYDVYIGARAVNSLTTLQLRLGMSTDYYTVKIKPAGIKHRNFEILLDRNLNMAEKKIHIASNGLFYLGYIKFIPAENRRKVDHPLDELVSVSKEPRALLNEAAKKIDERIKSGYFKERIYVEKRPQPTPLAESTQRGYMLFNHNWMDLLFKVNVPKSDPGKIILKAATTPGEFEPITFGVRGLRNINGLTIRQSKTFQSATGLKATVKVDFAIIEPCIKRSTSYNGPSEFIDGPQYLEPAYPLNLKPAESRQFWITLQATPDTQPGLYSGEFELKNSSNTETIPVELEIYPFKLDPIKGYDLGFWATTLSNEHAEQMIKDMAEHSMTSVFLHAQNILKIKGETLQNLTIDFDSCIFPTIVESFRKYGMKGNLILGSELIMSKALSFPEAQQQEVYKKLVSQLDDYTHKNDGPKILYMSYDEILSHPANLSNFTKEVRLQKELGLTTANDHIWYKTSRPLQKELDQVADFIDVFIVRFNTKNLWYVDSWEKMIDTVIKREKKLYAYNSNNAITFAQTAAMRYIAGWFFRNIGQGSTGQMVWTYHMFHGSPYNDLDGTDWCYIYPPYGNRKGGPSIDFESFREGADDLRYILTLENLIARAKQRNVDTNDAQKVLDSLKNSFDLELFRKESVFFDSQWDTAWTDASGKRFASGQFNLPNGWNLNDYDQARRQIAEAIIQLKARLK